MTNQEAAAATRRLILAGPAILEDSLRAVLAARHTGPAWLWHAPVAGKVRALRRARAAAARVA